MRILYHVALSPFSRKVRLVLAEKGLEFTLKFEKTWERRPEFLALNPAGEVPVLIEPDGAVVVGTEAGRRVSRRSLSRNKADRRATRRSAPKSGG